MEEFMPVRKWLYLALVAVFFLPAGSSGAATVTREEMVTVGAEGVRAVSFRNMKYADIVYRGTSTREFSVRFVKRVDGAEDSETGDFLSAIRLDTSNSGGTVVLDLTAPKQSGSGFLDRLFNRRTWKVTVEVTGPSAVNVDVDADFSDIRTSATSGTLSLSTDFSTAAANDHEGSLRLRCDFSSFTGENIDGSFDVDSHFSHVSVMMGKLSGDSRVTTSFGNGEIGIPGGAGAVFRVTRSFSGIGFQTTGPLTNEGEKGERRVLNGGGPNVTLDAEFGGITVRTTPGKSAAAPAPAGSLFLSDRVMPLVEGAWWTYSENSRSLTLRVARVRTEDNRTFATLAFDQPDNAPFGSIEVFETEEGLFLGGINSSFFGRTISGILMNPPVLWLPYRTENSPVVRGDILGTVRITAFMDSADTPDGRMRNVISYSLEGTGRSTRHIQLVPGVGFISFDNLRLVSYNLASGARSAGEIPSQIVEKAPAFEEGVIHSVRVGGNRIFKEQDIVNMLAIQPGETYTRAQIDEAMKRLDKEPLIDFSSYSVDAEGNLFVRIYEIRPFVRNFDMECSFSRVGGLGLGPDLKITSRVGPLSEVHGGAQYHWGNKDWTWEAGASRSFFDANTLTIGGGYRFDFESAMDWVIPDDDAYMNAFLLGRQTTNYSHVEGGYAYLTQKVCKDGYSTIRYFEDNYGSVGKETDWSLFNRNKTKEDNPALGANSARWISGVRFTLTGHQVHMISDVRTKFEIERTYQKTKNDYPAYTRIIASASWNMRYWYENLLKFRVIGGYSNTKLPDQKSFRLGGLNTLRGFGAMSIPGHAGGNTPFTTYDGGDRMFLANFDYFWGRDLALIFFGDVGGVWRKGEPINADGIKRDLGIGLALGSDFFSSVEGDEHKSGFRVNWARPVGNEKHVSRWTVNFVREY
jgi:hypothetical protein